MVGDRYSVIVKPENRTVEVKFNSSVNFDLMERVLNQLRHYIAENYQIRIMGYINRDCNYLRAFMFALSLFGVEDRIVFENRSRYSKAERRKNKVLVRELRSRGYSIKQIATDLNIPLKTIYRWAAKQ